MATRFTQALKVAGTAAVIAFAAAGPANAAHAAAGAAHAAPLETVSRTFGPYSTLLGCDDNWAYYEGARNVVKLTYCTPTWQGYYFTVTWAVVTTY